MAVGHFVADVESGEEICDSPWTGMIRALPGTNLTVRLPMERDSAEFSAESVRESGGGRTVANFAFGDS